MDIVRKADSAHNGMRGRIFDFCVEGRDWDYHSRVRSFAAVAAWAAGVEWANAMQAG